MHPRFMHEIVAYSPSKAALNSYTAALEHEPKAMKHMDYLPLGLRPASKGPEAGCH